MKMSKKVEAAIHHAFCVDLTEEELNQYCQSLLILTLGTVRKLNGDSFTKAFVEAGMSEGVDLYVEDPDKKSH